MIDLAARLAVCELNPSSAPHEQQQRRVNARVMPYICCLVGAFVGAFVGALVGALVVGALVVGALVVGALVVGALVVGALVFAGSFCDVTQILNSFLRTWPVMWSLK